jgi:hypothetical protein
MINEWKTFKGTFSSQRALLFYAIAMLLLVTYIIIYQFAPLGERFDNLALNSITSLASLAVAGIATSIFLHYHPEDHPRRIWKNMMIGAWFWFVAEVTWQVYAFLFQEVPVPSIADLGWLAGFIFFTFALYHQYSAIKPAQAETIRTFAIGAWIFVLLIPLVLLSAFNAFSVETYIGFYYPFADLAVGIAGLLLVFFFRGGALMRPWFGLMVFGASDLLYAWAEKTQLYAWSVENGNLLTLFIDATYLLAYLILAIGFLGHWMLLTRGLHQTK